MIVLTSPNGYPKNPLPPLPAVYLEAFHLQERVIADDQDGTRHYDHVEYQRAICLYDGARQRVASGMIADHASQAAGLLVLIDEIHRFQEGAFCSEGPEKYGDEEHAALQFIERAACSLINWHFHNGAGALLPIAESLGLVHGSKRNG